MQKQRESGKHFAEHTWIIPKLFEIEGEEKGTTTLIDWLIVLLFAAFSNCWKKLTELFRRVFELASRQITYVRVHCFLIQLALSPNQHLQQAWQFRICFVHKTFELVVQTSLAGDVMNEEAYYVATQITKAHLFHDSGLWESLRLLHSLS